MRTVRDRGFTLIEMSAVVSIVGVLAVVAIVSYRKWVTTARVNEATNMVSNIRSAEEAFRSENGGYLNVSNGYSGTSTTVSLDYPAATPGAFKTAWGADCNVCVAPNSWRQLGVQSTAPVTYGYAVVAGDGSSAPPNILVNGQSSSLTALKGNPWYVAEADGDPLGSGTFTKIFGLSGNNELFMNNE